MGLTISSCYGILKKIGVFEVAMPYILLFMINIDTTVSSISDVVNTASIKAQSDVILGQFHPKISPQLNT
jgi:hypothetical protein